MATSNWPTTYLREEPEPRNKMPTVAEAMGHVINARICGMFPNFPGCGISAVNPPAQATQRQREAPAQAAPRPTVRATPQPTVTPSPIPTPTPQLVRDVPAQPRPIALATTAPRMIPSSVSMGLYTPEYIDQWR